MECLACHTENTEGARFCAKCGAPLPVHQGEEADPLVGTTIGGRYRVTGILGEGGMGRVYAAEQQMGTSVRKVAIKTLLSNLAKDPKTVARFMREVGTVSELEHPNTIKVYDCGQIEGTGELYIAMELLQGTALEDLLANGQALPPERCDRILGQVCGSLQEAHDKGIVHRDLKPANIYITTRAGETDVVKVLDFGIAKRGSRESQHEKKLTQQGTILGTPPYMSPEQFSGKDLDARSDLYSLGVVAYEMLTGRLPFEADTPWQWMTQHVNAQPFPFETTPAGNQVPLKMRQAVLRALAKDPAQRPQSARELFEDLTLGATRMSALGLGAGGVDAIRSLAPSGLPVSSSAASYGPTPVPSPRPGGTQVGEPLVPDAPAYDAQPYQGPGLTAPGLDPGVAYGHPAVKTQNGTAFPAPPARPQKSGGSGAVAVILGLCVLAGAAGTFIYWRTTQPDEVASKKGDDTDETSDESETTTATATATVSHAPTGDVVASAPPSASSAPPEPSTPTTVAAGPVASVPGHSLLPTEQEWSAAAPLTTVKNAAKLGCEARAVREWVRVLCKDKNDSGGSPAWVSVDHDGGRGDTFTNIDGPKTSLIYAFEEGADLKAGFKWTDKTSEFVAKWPRSTPKPPSVGEFAATAPPPVAAHRPPISPIPPAIIPPSRPPPPPPPPPPATTIKRPEPVKRPEFPQTSEPIKKPEPVKRPELPKTAEPIKRPKPPPGAIKVPKH